MARYKTTIKNSFFRDMMIEAGYQKADGSIDFKRASEETGIGMSTLCFYADLEQHRYWEALIEVCDAFDIEEGDFVRGMLKKPARQSKKKKRKLAVVSD